MRICKGWTQEELAEKLGWAVNTYAKIERGESGVKLDKLKQIAEAIGVDVSELVNLNERTVFNFAENCTSSLAQNSLANCTILLSESQCVHELETARLVIVQRDKEIEWLKEESARLKEIIALQRGGRAT
ncbi:MAG: helix-turn-helix transcriptional regulator [Chromatiaceae bacterium]